MNELSRKNESLLKSLYTRHGQVEDLHYNGLLSQTGSFIYGELR